VAQHLSLEDINSLLKVSHGGNSFDFPWVWREVAKRFLTDCPKESPPSEDVIRQNVIRQYCRVQLHANFLYDKERFKQLTLKYETYDLNRDAPFQTWWRYVDRYLHYYLRGKSQSNFVHWYVQRVKEYGCFEEFLGMKLKDLPDDEKCYEDWEFERVRLKKENGETLLWDRSFYKEPTPEQAKEMFRLNEKLAAENDFDAIVRQYQGLWKEDYGYEKDSTKADKITQSLMSKDTELSDELRMKMLMTSGDYYYSDYQSIIRVDGIIRDIITKAKSQGVPWAFYLKAHGLKKGLFGYTNDQEKAHRYILKHNIPY